MDLKKKQDDKTIKLQAFGRKKKVYETKEVQSHLKPNSQKGTNKVQEQQQNQVESQLTKNYNDCSRSASEASTI